MTHATWHQHRTCNEFLHFGLAAKVLKYPVSGLKRKKGRNYEEDV